MDTTKVTFSTVYNDFKEALTGIGDSLKVGAEHVYEVLVKQQVVNSVTWSIFLVLGILLLWNFILAAKNKEEKWAEYSDPTTIGVVRVFQAILGVIIFCLCLFHIDTLVMGFINPEYGAMKDIANFIRH